MIDFVTISFRCVLRGIILIVGFCVISHAGFCQDYQVEFKMYFQQGDTLNQLRVLQAWKAEKPEDAELLTSLFDYHFSRSKQDFIHGKNDNTESNRGNSRYIDKESLKKGLDAIDQGISLYPDRLDMRFDKIQALSQASLWDDYTSEIVRIISHSKLIDNKWLGANMTEWPDAEKRFMQAIHRYQIQLYEDGRDELIMHMRSIATEMVSHYPEHVESLSNLSITHLVSEEYDKALVPLLKAEKINSKDPIVLANIAQCYKLKGYNKDAIKYYEKVVQYGDEGMKEYAEGQIKELK